MTSGPSVGSIREAAQGSVPGASLVREGLLSIDITNTSSPSELVKLLADKVSEVIPENSTEESAHALRALFVSTFLTSELSRSLQELCRTNKGELRQSTVFAVTRFVAKNEMLLALSGRMVAQIQSAGIGASSVASLEACSVCAQEAREAGASLIASILGREPVNGAQLIGSKFLARIGAFHELFPANPRPGSICEHIGVH